jgi:hypothetical protein
MFGGLAPALWEAAENTRWLDALDSHLDPSCGWRCRRASRLLTNDGDPLAPPARPQIAVYGESNSVVRVGNE